MVEIVTVCCWAIHNCCRKLFLNPNHEQKYAKKTLHATRSARPWYAD